MPCHFWKRENPVTWLWPVQGIGWVLQGKLHTRWYNTPLGPGKIKRIENFILLPINQLSFSGGRSWHTDYLHTTVIPVSRRDVVIFSIPEAVFSPPSKTEKSSIKHCCFLLCIFYTHQKRCLVLTRKKLQTQKKGDWHLNKEFRATLCLLLCYIHPWFNKADVTQRTSCSAAWKLNLNSSSLSWSCHCIPQGTHLCRCWGVFLPSSLHQVMAAAPAVSFEKRFLIFLHKLCSTETEDVRCFWNRGGWKLKESVWRGVFAKLLSKPKLYRFPSDSCKKI